MKTLPALAVCLPFLLAGSSARADDLPMKLPMVETEVRANFALLPLTQTTFRYASPTELSAAHALSLYFGPKLKLGQDDGAAWIMPQVGVRALLGSESDFQTIISVWGKFSMLDRAISYRIMADLALTLPIKQDGLNFDVRHQLDYNIVIPTESAQEDTGHHQYDVFDRRRRERRVEPDPWKRDHCLLQLGLHLQHRNEYVDLGPAVGVKYQWLRVSVEYLLGFQEANLGQSFRFIVGTDLNI